jgi:hypothetical protein
MRSLFAILPAVLCFAQEADLPSQLARIQRLPTEQVRNLQARLAMDPAPAAKKAYHEVHIAYVLATRLQKEDPKFVTDLVDRTLKAHETSQDPEIQALIGSLNGVKIGLSPMSAMVLSPRAMGLFGESLAKKPGNPRALMLRGIHTLYMPAFVGGGAKAALPILQEAVKRASEEARPTDPWAPSWGRIESMGWLAMAQIEAGQLDQAKQTADQVLALEPGNGFVTRMVLPQLQGKKS